MQKKTYAHKYCKCDFKTVLFSIGKNVPERLQENVYQATQQNVNVMKSIGKIKFILNTLKLEVQFIEALIVPLLMCPFFTFAGQISSLCVICVHTKKAGRSKNIINAHFVHPNCIQTL